jgi:hypothetical protein
MSNLEANIKITLNSSSVSGVIEKLAELLAEKKRAEAEKVDR